MNCMRPIVAIFGYMFPCRISSNCHYFRGLLGVSSNPKKIKLFFWMDVIDDAKAASFPGLQRFKSGICRRIKHPPTIPKITTGGLYEPSPKGRFMAGLPTSYPNVHVMKIHENPP